MLKIKSQYKMKHIKTKSNIYYIKHGKQTIN